MRVYPIDLYAIIYEKSDKEILKKSLNHVK